MKKIFQSRIGSAALFLLAVVLLLVATVGGTQAALQVRSNNYYSAFNLDHIGVSLIENEEEIAYRKYGDTAESEFTEQQGQITLKDLNGDKEFLIGKEYPFELKAYNSGGIDEYVRVTIRKYWRNETDASLYLQGDEGSKVTDSIYLADYIMPGYRGDSDYAGCGSGWIEDPGARTEERSVYYYTGILAPGNESTPLFNVLSISPAVAKEAAKTTVTEGGVTRTVYTYAFDGYGFVIEATVDAVQTHHARAAMTSAWGTGSAVMGALNLPAETTT